MDNQTIIALSSGSLPSGIAVIRISGEMTMSALDHCLRSPIVARKACLAKIYDGPGGEALDEGLVLWFPGPNSFTGEDCAELQVHGGVAVVSAILNSLTSIDGIRLAEAGEFSRRAFMNGRVDLTEVDGISDLISAETDAQRRLALAQSQGALRGKYEDWRKRLIHIRAMIEAEFDFSDEEDVPEDISKAGMAALSDLSSEIQAHVLDNRSGEIIQDGFKIALMGKPNAGKSSLLNALAKRDVAIVTDIAGTTRDVLDVSLDIGGYKVILYDTAGIRESFDDIELEGIRRAKLKADESDLVIWLTEDGNSNDLFYQGETEVITVESKSDRGSILELAISSMTGEGIDGFIACLKDRIIQKTKGTETGLITRQRYRDYLRQAHQHLDTAMFDSVSIDMELRAEELRLAGDCIGRVTGKVDVEDLLDVIFSEFCVGK